MQITPIPCLTDNYAYIISSNKIVGVIDPSEADPVINFLKKKKSKIKLHIKHAPSF